MAGEVEGFIVLSSLVIIIMASVGLCCSASNERRIYVVDDNRIKYMERYIDRLERLVKENAKREREREEEGKQLEKANG